MGGHPTGSLLAIGIWYWSIRSRRLARFLIIDHTAKNKKNEYNEKFDSIRYS